MFAQRANPVTGEMEWVEINDDDNEAEAVIDLIASSQYLDMLNDSARNHAYNRAIQSVVRPGCTVLDIGTGTGLLAMFAAKSLSPRTAPVQVVACECFAPMAKLASRVIAHNGLDGTIHVINRRSEELQLEEIGMADVIVTEIYDSQLLGEGLLPTMRDATARLLKETGHVIPRSAQLFGQLVESDVIARWQGNAAPCTSFKPLREAHLDKLWPKHLKALSRPFLLFDFLLAQPPLGNQCLTVEVPVVDDGQLAAVVVWWQSQLDPAGDIEISTTPAWIAEMGSAAKHAQGIVREWCDHWKQCWVPTGCRQLEAGQVVEVKAAHDDIEVRIAVGIGNNGEECQGLENLQLHLLGAQQLWELSDVERNTKFRWAVQQAVQEARDHSSQEVLDCLMFDEGALMAQHLQGIEGVKGVTVVQETALGVQVAAEAIRQLPHPNVTTLRDNDLMAPPAEASAPTGQWSICLATMHFWSLGSQPPWSHYLAFDRKCAKLQAMGLLRQGFCCVPFGARLCGVAVSMPDLWRTRRALGIVEGCDLELANKLLAAVNTTRKTNIFSRPIWCCGNTYEELSERCTLSQMTTGCMSLEQNNVSRPKVLKSGICDAIVVWLDYVLNRDGDVVVSNAPHPKAEPHYAMQAIALLPKPFRVQADARHDGVSNYAVCISINWNRESGDLELDAQFEAVGDTLMADSNS